MHHAKKKQSDDQNRNSGVYYSEHTGREPPENWRNPFEYKPSGICEKCNDQAQHDKKSDVNHDKPSF